MQTFRTILIETLVVTLLIAAIAAAVAPNALGMQSVTFHPLWLGVLAMTARYGPLGLVLSLSSSVALVVGLDLFLLGGATLATRFESQTDLLAFVSATVVALIAMSHASRRKVLEEQNEAFENEIEDERSQSKSLSEANLYLRQRCDRMDASVRLWRHAARCLERGDLAQAADAALDLCTRRVGARHAYFVEAKSGELRGESHGIVADVVWSNDKTLSATLTDGHAHLVFDVTGADVDDSDVTVPVRDEVDNELLGVIALRGADPSFIGKAELHDLALIAEWLAPLVARKLKGPRLRDASGVAAV